MGWLKKLTDTLRVQKCGKFIEEDNSENPSSKNSVIESQQTPINGTKSISKKSENQLKCVGKYCFTHVKK